MYALTSIKSVRFTDTLIVYIDWSKVTVCCFFQKCRIYFLILLGEFSPKVLYFNTFGLNSTFLKKQHTVTLDQSM